MKSQWNEVRLGEVVSYRKEFITIDDSQVYDLCRVQTNSKGIVLRERKNGFDIKTKSQQVCKAGDFLVAEMDARFGGYGIVPAELEGAIVSSHYFLYEVDEEQISRDFLDFYSQTPAFFKQVDAKGSTNYAAIRPAQILNFLIPLPPLNEQQRIVSKLDAVKTSLTELEQLRARQNHDIKALLNKLFEKLFNDAILVTVGEVLIGKRNNVSIEPTQTYQQITVRMDHKGVVLRQLIKGSEVGSAQLLANQNDFIISKIDARNGAMGLVPSDLDGGIVTNDFPLYSFSDQIRPGFFSFVVNTRYFDEACKNASEGTTNRKRLKTSKFESILIPLPTLAEQDSLLQLLNSLSQLQAQQVAGAGMAAQLMPSLLAQAFRT